VLGKIEEWIHQVNASHEPVRQSCSAFQREFEGFYSLAFLDTAFFVVTDDIPKPDFTELRAAGLGDFIDMDVAGITYNNTYYVKRAAAQSLRLHFHELVHVAQWRELGVPGFITRYIREIQQFQYNGAPLEIMAYSLDGHYQAGGQSLNIEQFMQRNL